MDDRVRRLETQVDEIRAQILGLHSTSMAFVTEAFAQMERRLRDQSEANTNRIEAQIAALGERAARLEVRAGLVGLIGGAIPATGLALIAWLSGHLR